MWTLMVGLPLAAAAPMEREAVVHALSSRDAVPCAALQTSAETLQEIVQTVSMPPWVPMRAASCLLQQHAPEIADDLRAWVVDPATRGLGLLVVSQLDRLPAPLATELARLSLTRGPDPHGAARRLARSERAELRALVTP